MNKKDRETLEMLGRELRNAAENTEMPQKLEKENIVALLKNGDKNKKDFSDKTGTNKVIYLKRIASAAAVFIVVIAIAAVGFSRKSFIFRSGSIAKSGFEMDSPVINFKSREEVEKAVKDIINDKKSPGASEEEKSGELNYIAKPNDKASQLEHGAIDVADSVSSREADILKTDGKYLYIVTSDETSSSIKIVSAVPAEEMHTVSTVNLSDFSENGYTDDCFDIYLKGNSLIALIKRYPDGSKAESSTVALFYDISDPASPVETRKHIQDGSYVSSKIYGNKLCLITNKAISENEEEIPSFSVNGIISRLSTENIFMAVNDPEANCLFITLTDIYDSEIPVGKLAVLGSGSNLCCSRGSVYVTRNFVSVDSDEQGNRKSLTEIYKFSSDLTGIRMCGSYVVEGTVPSSSFMDENGGYLRVAALKSNSGSIYILNDKMELVGSLENAFNISFIPNIKFIGEKAYVINGISSGALTVIDLSDPASPESHISENSDGFGLDIFRISSLKYIDIRSDMTNGSFRITLYDMSNPDEPKAISSYNLDSVLSVPGGGDSRSFVLLQDGETFGIPVVKADEEGSVVSEYILFSVADGIISKVGIYSHGVGSLNCAAVRAAGIVDTLYTVSGDKVVAFSMTDFSVISSTDIK